MKTKIQFFAILLLGLILSFCSNPNIDGKNSEKVLKRVHAFFDTSKTHREPYANNIINYNRAKKWSKKLMVDNIDTSLDKFQLKIWFNVGGLSSRKRLFVINCSTTDLQAKLYRFEESYTNRGEIGGVKMLMKNPKSGWNSFTDQFFSDDFFSLFQSHADYEDGSGTDVEGVIFELITSQKYSFADYFGILTTTQDMPIVNLVKRLVVLIEKEFDFSQI